MVGAKPDYIILDEGTTVTNPMYNSYMGPVADGAPGGAVCVSSAKISGANHFMHMVRDGIRAHQRTIDARLDPANAGRSPDELKDKKDVADVVVVELQCHL